MKQFKKIERQLRIILLLYELMFGTLKFILYFSMFLAFSITIFLYIIFITLKMLFKFFVIISVEIPSNIWVLPFAVDRTLKINYNNKQ